MATKTKESVENECALIEEKRNALAAVKEAAKKTALGKGLREESGRVLAQAIELQRRRRR